MDKRIWFILIWLMCTVGISEAQVTQGTVFSKTEDGNGNKITSTVVGLTRGLDVSIISGGSGGATYLDADGIANQTASAVHGQTYMYNGATWDRVRGSILTGLEVNCVTGCAGGASTPSDAFANPVTAGLQMGFNMVYNGATWDRLRGTVAGGALVNISNASLAVTGTFFQAIQPVSGTVAVSNAFLLDATFTGRFAAAYVDADTIANQTTTAVHGQSYFYNGATWDRMRGTIAGGLLVDVSDAFLLDATFTTRINTLGQKTMANSTPVVLASDQTSIPVAATVSNAFLLDATFTGRFAAAYVDADTIANQTTTAVHGQMYGYNGATWDRLRSTIAGGLLVDVSDLFLLDATLTNRFPAGSTPADNESNAVTISRIGNFNYVFDGATWDRWTGAVTQSGTWNIGTVTTVTTVTTVGAVTSITNPVTVLGNKTNNNAAPGATNIGALPCVANAVAPTWTEGNQVGCSTTLGGGERVVSETAANFNVRPDTSGAIGAAPPVRANYIGGLSSGATGGLVAGVAVCDTFVNINISTVTTTLLVTGVSGRHVRICSMNIVTTLANTVALISGTGATCGTGTTGMNGGTTAATGWSFAANGGLTQGSGVGVVNQTNATGDSVCLVSGVATQLSGRISYTIY